MNVLFLTTVLPGRKTMGSEVASQAVIDALLKIDVRVVTLGYLRKGESGPTKPTESPIGVRAIETKDAGYAALGWFAQGLLTNLPYSAAKYRSTAFVKRVRAEIAERDIDAVIIDHAQLAWLINAIPSRLPIIAVVHNIEHEMYEALAADPSRRPWSRWVYRREARLIERLERELAASADHIWALTEHDAGFFSGITDGCKVQVVALSGEHANSRQAAFKRCDIALIGSWSWRANADALTWFLDNVYPQLPHEISIQVAGKGAEWLIGRYPNVDYRGFVPDAQAFLAQARVVAIPTLSGGGIQIKTLDAIAAGSHIVATSVALRGIHNPPSTVTVADKPERFAHDLIAAVVRPQTGAQLSEVARWTQERHKSLLDTVHRSLLSVVTTASPNLAKAGA
jgi:hypothetical protein